VSLNGHRRHASPDEAIFSGQQGLQIWSVAPPPDSGSAIRATSVRLVIREVYPGTKYDHTCVSEIEVVGTTR
jgi:hypothetical protein